MENVQRKSSFQHPYDLIRQQPAPMGVRCPHCGCSNKIFFSSNQLRSPMHKRLVFCYLRCHSCSHRFQCFRFVSVLFWTAAAVALMLVGVVS